MANEKPQEMVDQDESQNGTESSKRSRSSSSGGTSRSRTTASSSRGRSGGSSSGGSNRTKEQLYNQAKRLKIEGRSTMNKAQLERAISRARS
jgi:hypothetical protein